MERKRRGSGRLRQLPSGRWQAAYIGPDAKLHKAPRTYASEHDAEGWLAGERRAESTTVSMHRIESDSSLDGMLGVDRRAQSLETAGRRPVHCAVRSNVRIRSAAEVRGEVSRLAGIHG